MQTIYATTHTSNFTVISNSLIDSPLPPVAKAVLQHLISKPKNWRLNKQAIKKTLGLSSYAVQKAVNILRNLGYLMFDRLKSGHGVWKVFDTPQTSMVKPSFEIPTLDNQPVLTNTDLLKNTQYNNTAPVINQAEQNVVVFDAGAENEPPPIPLPDSLKGSQAKAAHKLLSNITPDQAAAILMVFNAAIQAKKVNNPVGYLNSLVKAAQNGTLTASEPAQQAKPITASERIAKEQAARKQAQNRLKVDNEAYFKDLMNRFGDKAAKVVTKFGNGSELVKAN